MISQAIGIGDCECAVGETVANHPPSRLPSRAHPGNRFCLLVYEVTESINRRWFGMYSLLLVDDEPDLLAVWHLILSGEGYDVRCAANGAEALELMRERVPHLVITDWMMPLMGGAEPGRQLRADPQLARAPIFVHTAAPLPQKHGNGWGRLPSETVPMQLLLTTVARLCARG
jgi:CheY-like chemotaxis protein